MLRNYVHTDLYSSEQCKIHVLNMYVGWEGSRVRGDGSQGHECWDNGVSMTEVVLLRQ